MKKKIIYIAGYSRSGSTILDILLSSHKDIFGTGELVYLFSDWLDSNRKCTCGHNYANCAFWKNYYLPLDFNFQKATAALRKLEGRHNLSKLLQNKIKKSDILNYNIIQNSLFNYISATSGKNIIIDSSKTSRDMAGRFYALHKYTDFDVYVIHLVKNGESIVESYVTKGRNWALEGYAKNERFLAERSSIGWLLANRITLKLGAKMPAEKYCRIRYEDLVNDPQLVLNKMGDFLNMDLEEVIKNIKADKSFISQHNVGGNRLRLEKEIKFKTSESKKVSLSFKNRLVFKLIAGNLNNFFRYSN